MKQTHGRKVPASVQVHAPEVQMFHVPIGRLDPGRRAPRVLPDEVLFGGGEVHVCESGATQNALLLHRLAQAVHSLHELLHGVSELALTDAEVLREVLVAREEVPGPVELVADNPRDDRRVPRRANETLNLTLGLLHRLRRIEEGLRPVLEPVPDHDADTVPLAQVEEVRVPVRVLEGVYPQRVHARGGDERYVAFVYPRVLRREEIPVRLEPVGVPAHRNRGVAQRAHQPRLAVQIQRPPQPSEPPRVLREVQRSGADELGLQPGAPRPGAILRLRVHLRGVVRLRVPAAAEAVLLGLPVSPLHHVQQVVVGAGPRSSRSLLLVATEAPTPAGFRPRRRLARPVGPREVRRDVPAEALPQLVERQRPVPYRIVPVAGPAGSMNPPTGPERGEPTRGVPPLRQVSLTRRG